MYPLAHRLGNGESVLSKPVHLTQIMQLPFSDCTRSIIQQAQAEARELNQEFVGTEHLAVSLLKVQTCEAMRALRAHHVDPDAARATLLSMMNKATEPPVISGDLPLSPRAQRAINAAIVAAQSMRQSKITTRVLLLALMEEDGAPLVTALRNSGADIDTLRQSLQQPLEDPEG